MSKAHVNTDPSIYRALDREFSRGNSGRRIRALSAMVAGVLACALLGSCNGGAEPTVSPQETQSPQNETPTDDYTIPPRPDVDPVIEPELSGDPAADALSVALYFAQLYPYIYKTGDTTQWDAYSAPECEYCLGASDEARIIAADGGWVDGDLDPSRFALSVVDESACVYQVQLIVTRTPFIEYSASGEIEYEGGEFLLVITLALDSSWQVTSFQIGDPAAFTAE